MPFLASALAMSGMGDAQACLLMIREVVSEMARACAAWFGGIVRREPLPERPLVAVAVAVAAGCGLPAVVDLSPVVWWLVAAVALVAWALLAGLGRHGWAAVALLGAVVGGAAGWSAIRSNLFPCDDLAWSLTSAPQPVAVEGIVEESPRRLSAPVIDPLRSGAVQAAVQRPSSECVVAVRAVRRGATWRTASGRLTLIVDGEPPDVVAGCRVRVFGRGMRPPPPLNPGEFDFRERARSLRCL